MLSNNWFLHNQIEHRRAPTAVRTLCLTEGETLENEVKISTYPDEMKAVKRHLPPQPPCVKMKSGVK